MPVKRPKKLSAGEELFALQCRAMGVHMEREVKFHPDRMWRADFCNRSRMIIVEISGGVWMGSKGGHSSGTGITRDCEKHSNAALLGYRVFMFTTEMVTSGYAISMMIQEFKKGVPNVP